MKTNYDSLKEHNETLARYCISADALVKTYPEKAALLYGKALNSFLSVICSDNDIAFDRIHDLNPVNMIGTAYSCGVISKYEKGVLDDMRYTAFLAENPRLSDRRLDSKSLIDKVINFFGMVMRYYHLEEETYSEDILPIGQYEVIDVLKNFELDTAYDKVYLAGCKESFALIAQYVRDRSDFADEVFGRLESGSVKFKVPSGKLIKPEIVPHQDSNNIILIKSVIPDGFVKFSFDDFFPLLPDERIKFIVSLAEVLNSAHEAGLSLSGFQTHDIWVSFKGLKCMLSGMESRAGCAMGTKKSMNADVKNFAALTAAVFPEYDKIPVAGLTVKHALMGSGKVDMERVYSALKKEALHRSYEPKPLSSLVTGDIKELYRSLSESVLPPDASVSSVLSDTNEVDFTEMYSKIFG